MRSLDSPSLREGSLGMTHAKMTRMNPTGLLLALLFLAPITFAGDDLATRGASVFKTSKCITCHGADGSGKTPVGKSLQARDLRAKHVKEMKDEEIAAVIKKGRNRMPAFKSLSNDDVRALVAFIRKLGS